MSNNHPYNKDTKHPFQMTSIIEGQPVTIIIPDTKDAAASRIWLKHWKSMSKTIRVDLADLLQGKKNPTEEFKDKMWTHVCKEYKDFKAAGKWEVEDGVFDSTLKGMIESRRIHLKEILVNIQHYEALLKRQEEEIQGKGVNDNGNNGRGGGSAGGSGFGKATGIAA